MLPDESPMYRFAMKATLVASAGSAVLLICHFLFGVFSDRGAAVLAVGIGFWLLMFFGYRADLKQRSEDAP